MPPAEMQDADGAGEQAEHADHGKSGQDGEHERLGHLARHHGKADGGDRECQRQQHHEAHAAVSLGAVCGGRGVAHGHVDIGHGLGKIADSEMSWPNIVITGWSGPCGLAAVRLGTIAGGLALFVARMVVNALLTRNA